ncbi:MAG: 30S ribosomal protein S7 [Limnochordaceae bacterium]|nr:30S ribosomal protein S7 [Limnochordaceae bacterium]
MPRRGAVPRRPVPPDAVYGSPLVTSLINVVMKDGKRSLAQRIVYSALQQVADKSGKSGLEALEEALKNIMPVLEVRPRRVGGATYQVPMEVRPERRQSLGLRWLVGYARQRGDQRVMADKLAAEILDAMAGQGGAVKKREDTHRMAEANRAFAHYRW